MPTYTTEYVKNLRTGESFTFEVPQKSLDHMEHQKKMVAAGKAPMLGNMQTLVEMYEFSFFPSYRELLKIWFDNGFTTELITQILQDFGIPDSYIPKLLEDENYVSNVKSWFEGITCDGERASRTIRVVYETTKRYYSATASVERASF